jgi:hypothetical protein
MRITGNKGTEKITMLCFLQNISGQPYSLIFIEWKHKLTTKIISYTKNCELPDYQTDTDFNTEKKPVMTVPAKISVSHLALMPMVHHSCFTSSSDKPTLKLIFYGIINQCTELLQSH